MTATADAILVVEDDLPIRRLLRTALATDGFAVLEATTLHEATKLVVSLPPAAILLDPELPDGDGLGLLRSLREWSTTPVIVLSARDREHDKVIALDAGADDYLTKPFGTRELLARVRVALRRARGTVVASTVIIGPIAIDSARHEVTVGGKLVHLTPIEFRLLALLARHAGKVLTHRQLLHEVWGPRTHQSQYLRVHMAALRKKLEADPARPRWLTTEVGIGYRLQDE